MDHLREMTSESTLDSMLARTKNASAPTMAANQQPPNHQESKKPRPPDETLNCPRCDSTNTKFCYYNNYSLSQPRYFCKSCRRYWTKGGTLRNVPVGGGCRKNKRSSPSSSTSNSPCSSSILMLQDHHHNHDIIQSSSSSSLIPSTTTTTTNVYPMLIPTLFPHLPYHESASTTTNSNTLPCGDLALAFARLQRQLVSGGGGFDQYDDSDHNVGGGHGADSLVSVLRNPGNAHFENNVNGMSYDFGVFDSIRGGGHFVDDHDREIGNDHGIGINLFGGTMEIDHMDSYHDHQDHHHVMKYTASEAAVTAGESKREIDGEKVNVIGENQDRILLGFPWQINAAASVGGGGGGGDNVDTLRSWNSGIVGSPWQGLVQSSLM